MASKKPDAQSELLPPAETDGAATDKASERKHYGNHDGICHFEHHGKRCPLPGNLTMSMGRHGTYYCLWHSNPENRRADALQDEHFDRFCDPENGAACVADYIEIHYQNRPQDAVEQLLKEHPEWFRQAGEGKLEYQDRIQALIAPLRAAQRA